MLLICKSFFHKKKCGQNICFFFTLGGSTEPPEPPLHPPQTTQRYLKFQILTTFKKLHTCGSNLLWKAEQHFWNIPIRHYYFARETGSSMLGRVSGTPLSKFTARKTIWLKTKWLKRIAVCRGALITGETLLTWNASPKAIPACFALTDSIHFPAQRNNGK